MNARRTWRTALAVIALAVIALACEGTTGLVSTNPRGTIRGTILAAGGAGAPNVTVRIQGPEPETQTRTAATGADGTYAFTGLDAGSYTVTVVAPIGFVVTSPNPVPVTLETGGTATADFSVSPGSGTVPAPTAIGIAMTEADRFVPAVDTVRTGGKVTWTNQDNEPHTTGGDDGAWADRTVPPDSSTTITLTSAGTFPYRCTIHAGMTGTIVVRD